jgi:protein phosphatase
MKVVIRGTSDLGRKRPINEDSHAWLVPGTKEELESRGILLVVADGMGGANAGERASRLAVDTVIKNYREAKTPDPLASLQVSLEAANHAVHTESLSSQSLSGMGTTCTAAVLRDRDLLVGHVGDSRAYLLKDGRISQMTSDHSLVAHLVERGQITPEEARIDPRRNVVTRSVGVGPAVEVDVECFEGALDVGDTVLLCSDGLHGLVTDTEMADLIKGPDLDRACRDLIELANQRGGPDNITVILARLVADE